ncbi:amphi-Trp domain-containing protein [Natrononativus amylolyticus]|uniref:amphi-Trp domain-containing protein n=1 Tax=Natrononativus amylolyticus TaxID=2963434 RepID=UPI0020CEE8ED|nr:amphi-Trp domain-containing protein [Natrononativus amylolyticus]
MSEETELEYEQDLSRAEIADHLEAFAENLRGDDEIEFAVGDDTVVVNPPETIEFEVEIEDESDDGGVERSIEFELEWMRGDDEEPLPER